MVHRQYIIEWKSVNDNIKQLSDVIAKEMWNDSQDKKPCIDRRMMLPCVKDNFAFPIKNDSFGVLKTINVDYILYFLDSIEQYNSIYQKIGNCEYNKEDNTLYVREGLIEGEYNSRIPESIYHELTHCFEYGMGMEKRETLYDLIKRTIEDNNASDVERKMSMLLYYTFPHEQDAFAHQFYAWLNNRKIDEDFEDVVIRFENYSHFLILSSGYRQFIKYDSNVVRTFLSRIGMTWEQFVKRIHYGKKRFKNKLRNVFERYCQENNSITIEAIIQNKSKEWMILEHYRKRYKDIDFG